MTLLLGILSSSSSFASVGVTPTPIPCGGQGTGGPTIGSEFAIKFGLTGYWQVVNYMNITGSFVVGDVEFTIAPDLHGVIRESVEVSFYNDRYNCNERIGQWEWSDRNATYKEYKVADDDSYFIESDVVIEQTQTDIGWVGHIDKDIVRNTNGVKQYATERFDVQADALNPGQRTSSLGSSFCLGSAIR